MNILVTGGLGYIGSHICVELAAAGYDAVIVDDCSNASPRVLNRLSEITGKTFPFYKDNVLDEAALERIFTEQSIDAVIHLAAQMCIRDRFILMQPASARFAQVTLRQTVRWKS